MTTTQLKKMINSCDFIPDAERQKIIEKSNGLSGKTLEVTYRKFKDAKNRIENVYISIALRHDPTKGRLLKEVMDTLKTINN